jgi:hypothetical protein
MMVASAPPSGTSQNIAAPAAMCQCSEHKAIV